MLTPPALAAPPLTLATVKVHLKLDPADPSEDALLSGYLRAAVGTFRTLSKRRWPEVNEPVDTLTVTDTSTVPATVRVVPVRYSDHAVLNADEQAQAEAWLLLLLGHWYENRGTVVVGLNINEVPLSCQWLMNGLREPTI